MTQIQNNSQYHDTTVFSRDYSSISYGCPLDDHKEHSLLDSTGIKEEKVKYVRDKLIVSGNITEHYHYQYPIRVGYSPENIGRRSRGKSSKRSNEYRRRSSHIAQNRVRRLVSTNFNPSSKFITLTFHNENDFDIEDIPSCNYEFKKFIQKLRYRKGKFKYIAVIEFQKRGAIHYHLLTDIDYINHEGLEDAWGRGYVYIQSLSYVKNIGAYMSKYMAKDVYDERLKGQKCYFTSRNLDRPFTVYGEQALHLIKETRLDKKDPDYSNRYNSELNGAVTFKEYNDLTQKEDRS